MASDGAGAGAGDTPLQSTIQPTPYRSEHPPCVELPERLPQSGLAATWSPLLEAADAKERQPAYRHTRPSSRESGRTLARRVLRCEPPPPFPKDDFPHRRCKQRHKIGLNVTTGDICREIS